MPSTIVIKVGTSSLTNDAGRLEGEPVMAIACTISQLIAQGYRVILVTSGAVGAGVAQLGLDSYPKELALKQACASIGQTYLMHKYATLFEFFGITVAQLLLTADDMRNRPENIRATLDELFSKGNVVPIVNENDTVSVDALRFGDNDNLSVLVARLIKADYLFLMTGADGLYKCENGKRTTLAEISNVDEAMQYIEDSTGKFSTGGMRSKLEAVKKATTHGITTFISHGHHAHRILDLLKGEGIGTKFLPVRPS